MTQLEMLCEIISSNSQSEKESKIAIFCIGTKIRCKLADKEKILCEIHKLKKLVIKLIVILQYFVETVSLRTNFAFFFTNLYIYN